MQLLRYSPRAGTAYWNQRRSTSSSSSFATTEQSPCNGWPTEHSPSLGILRYSPRARTRRATFYKILENKQNRLRYIPRARKAFQPATVQIVIIQCQLLFIIKSRATSSKTGQPRNNPRAMDGQRNIPRASEYYGTVPELGRDVRLFFLYSFIQSSKRIARLRYIPRARTAFEPATVYIILIIIIIIISRHQHRHHRHHHYLSSSSSAI